MGANPSYFSYGHDMMCIAAYHARRLSNEEGASQQRGARCISIGVILPCPKDPSGQLRNLLPHLPVLAQLADDVAHGLKAPDVALYNAQYAPVHRMSISPTLEQLSVCARTITFIF